MASAAESEVRPRAVNEVIRLRGVRTHNLKNIDVDLPRDRLVVLTGPSGSGKSSLAFDTLFAEGQRQYIESLSTYARQFLTQLERPDVDLIEGLEPTICIDQRPGQQGPRSTVATVTEIYDYLRLLFARLGEVFCHACAGPISQQSAAEIQTQLVRLEEGSKLILLAPVVRGRKGEHAEAFQQIRKAGFVRVRINGEMHDVDRLPTLDSKKSHTIEAVVDRIVVRSGVESRLAESLQLALKHGEGLVAALWLSPEVEKQAREQNESTERLWTERLYSTLYACPKCGLAYPEIEPRTFSFNSPYGACADCDGLGVRIGFDPDLILDHSLPLASEAITAWKGAVGPWIAKQQAQFAEFLTANAVPAASSFAQLKPAVQEKLLHGDGKKFLGLVKYLEQEYATVTEEERRGQLELFRASVACSACQGERLQPIARAVKIGSKSLPQVTNLPLVAAREFFAGLKWAAADWPVAKPLVSEVIRRLDFLDHVGLGYLTLDRPADTLSGGELQRVRLATGIGSGLVGVCYILDEPSIGLHPRDNERLIGALRELQQQGNTVIVVEHDAAMMEAADWLVDIGPGAGREGGQIVAQGTPAEVSACETSPTGNYLSGRERIEIPPQRRTPLKGKQLTLAGVTTNNLQNVTAHFPLGTLTCVTGVSGSGKSSLINETLAPALSKTLRKTSAKPGPFTKLHGLEHLDQVIIIDQDPLGRSPRSNAATYCGLFDEIRKLFAATKEAKQLGFKANRFSFNAVGGRCEECSGHGVRKIEMNFLPDIFVTCSACQGTRFNRGTLQVKYKQKTIAEVLQFSCHEAAVFFAKLETLHRPLRSLCDVGLGYLPIGQSATTLSGGESQRVKLATELAHRETGRMLYILDEPTTGLHFEDIRRLIAVLQKLVDRGHTVIVVEHHLDLMLAADWIIDLGPTGGSGGGRIIATGTPEEVASVAESATGQALQQEFARRRKG